MRTTQGTHNDTRHAWEKGVSIIELVSYIAIAALMLVAISMLLGSSIGANRFQFEQVLTTEDARRQLELMSDTLRNARNEGGNNWLLLAGDNEIGVRTDVNGDGTIEQVTYLLEGNDLKRSVGVLGESPTVRVVARSIRNELSNQPLFQYYNAEGEQIAAGEATSSTVELVEVFLLANVNETQAPDAGEIITEVKPRAENTRVIRLWPVAITLPDPASNAANEGDVTIVTTNPDTAEATSSIVTMTDLNDGRVGTYTGDHYVHLNYQTEVSGSDLPGWYAWVGPIIVGQQNGILLTVIDKFLQANVCLGNDPGQLFIGCSPRQVAMNDFLRQYFPILTYTQLSGEVDYVADIAYAADVPIPTPTPTESATPTPTPIPSESATPTPSPSGGPTPDPSSPPGGGGPLPNIQVFTINGVTECAINPICYPVDRTLHWSTTLANVCIPSWREGTMTLPSAFESILNIDENRTFTMTCSNDNGTVQATVIQTSSNGEIGCSCP